ncbi:MAG: Rpn family recombination-promoting nuclease/putative transposase [Clostridiales bacterium]|jgi:predicted transposase/invertase (TIGR01784 family)|nr:Rpn family recombination-promoting nuclease/putative transposase [Clostridiales bacterium]
MEKIYFNYEDDIINPCWDNVFKAIFTRDTPESHGALEYLLSAILKRDLSVQSMMTNEPPVDNINERQIRYDITCKFGNGELCNIEMSLNPDLYEPVRSEYYSGKLFTSQDIRGKNKSYSDLKHTYQIALLVNEPIYEDNIFVHNFMYYDEEHGVSLNGRTHIITIELSKLEQTAQKSASDMTALERWAVFFRYTVDKDKRKLVNEIIKIEEGIAMAGQVLLSISKDERERARLLSEYKFAVDIQSKMVDAERGGGDKRAIEIARKLLKRNRPMNEIIEDTGLTLDQIEELRFSN